MLTLSHSLLGGSSKFDERPELMWEGAISKSNHNLIACQWKCKQRINNKYTKIFANNKHTKMIHKHYWLLLGYCWLLLVVAGLHSVVVF